MQSILPLLAIAVVCANTASASAQSFPDHWAWHKPVRPAVPTLHSVSRLNVKNPIDNFIAAELEKRGLTVAPQASREQLVRRVTFDLIGLPPTPEEIDAFVRDPSPDAWEKVIDRLLTSPRYGERWGRHWLDLARYADSNGYEFDEARPDAWRYRDYVIRSFNADKPFDRFILEQLAGDELATGDRDGLIATGFNLLGPDMTDSSDPAQRRLNTLNDMTDTAGLAFLGLTIACARCHDHKFEPIPQADYYRLQAFFAPAAFRRDRSIASKEQTASYDAANAKYLEATKDLREAIDSLEGPYRAKLLDKKLARLSEEAQAAHQTPVGQRTGGQQELVAETKRLVVVSAGEIEKAMPPDDQKRLKTLQSRVKALDSLKPAPLPVAMGLTDNTGPPPKVHVLERGELKNPAAEVQPGFPAIVAPGSKPLVESGDRRLALARWIASPENPLTARVIVNRLWQHHFGRGLVATPSDFGLRGDRPTHPELLDWLATEFVKPADGRPWSLKRLHKLMLTSATYQQSTLASADSTSKDPENHLLSRMNRLRLEGEAVRDSLLAVSGRLNLKEGGPVVTAPDGGCRRSVYLFARRNLRHPFLEAFDLPDSNLSCPRRERSTTAPQALALLNATEAATAAKALADRLAKEGADEPERIERAYRLVLGRPPSAPERERAAKFLRESPLSELCRALFNTNEFVYLD
jgi:hypothetical protein